MSPLRRTAIARKTELKRGAPLRRRQELAQVSTAKRTVAKQKTRRDTGPTEATKQQLWVRAGGRCEVCRRDLTGGHPFSRHHRQPRGAGGTTRVGVNAITNLLLVCGTGTTGCHGEIESNRTVAYTLGLLVRTGYHPAEVPAFIRTDVHRTAPLYLTDDGAYAIGAP